MHNPLALARSLFKLFQQGKRRSERLETKSWMVRLCSLELEINSSSEESAIFLVEARLLFSATMMTPTSFDCWRALPHWLKSYREKPLILLSLRASLFPSCYLLHFSLSLHSPLPICLFSILLCSNFPFSSQPVSLWCLITILADISFHFLSSSPVLFLASHS